VEACVHAYFTQACEHTIRCTVLRYSTVVLCTVYDSANFRPYYGTSMVRLRYSQKSGEITVPDHISGQNKKGGLGESENRGGNLKNVIKIGSSTLHVSALCCLQLKKPLLKLAPLSLGP